VTLSGAYVYMALCDEMLSFFNKEEETGFPEDVTSIYACMSL
jgi:hypothetical protein